jgi:hypothetical protein
MMDDPINAPSAAVTGSLLLSPPSPDGFHRKIFPFAFYTHFTPKETTREEQRERKRNPY